MRADRVVLALQFFVDAMVVSAWLVGVALGVWEYQEPDDYDDVGIFGAYT